jgi:hypothetical protein
MESFLWSVSLGRSAVRFSLLQQVGDAHQIVSQYSRTHQDLESLTAFRQATFHATAAK